MNLSQAIDFKKDLNVGLDMKKYCLISNTVVSIALKLYPYDGRRCRPEKVHDFSDSEDSSIWEIKNLRCVTNAIYIIELYH